MLKIILNRKLSCREKQEARGEVGLRRLHGLTMQNKKKHYNKFKVHSFSIKLLEFKKLVTNIN